MEYVSSGNAALLMGMKARNLDGVAYESAWMCSAESVKAGCSGVSGNMYLPTTAGIRLG